MTRLKIRKNQIWQDKKNGDIMVIHNRAHDIYWNCIFLRGNTTHKISEFIINKYYSLVTKNMSIETFGNQLASTRFI